MPTPSPHPAGPRPGALAGLLVAGIALFAFAYCLRAGWAFDDGAYLPPGPSVTGVRDPLGFFSGGVWDFANEKVANVPLYRPMTTVALWALAPLLGATPAAWHLPGLVLHVLASVLVYLLARRLLPGGRFPSVAGAVIFAAHPVHVEAVAPALGFGHVLAAVFALVALHAQLSHARSGKVAWLAASALAAAGAMLTTEVGLAVPPLLVGLEWAERRRWPPARVLVTAAVPLAAVLWLRSRALATPLPLAGDAAALGNAAQFAAAYVKDLLLPWPQPLYLSVPRGGVAGPGAWALAALAILGAALLAARARPPDRGVVLFALATIALALGPPVAAGLNPRPLFAPRALYLSSVGLALLVAWGASKVPPRATRAAAGALAAVAALGIAGCVAGTHGWMDELTVRLRIVASDPEYAPAHLKLGEVHAALGNDELAERHLVEAVRLARGPDQRADAAEALAVHRGKEGRLAEAETLFRGVLAERPGRASAWVGLGNVTLLQGRLPAARDAYERALRLAPESAEAAHNLALVLEALRGAPGPRAP